jgi:hypothetical protein
VLTVEHGGARHTFEFRSHVLIGRGSECQIVIPDRTVSRRHAEIRRQEDGTWLVRDLGSGNGVLVKGEKVTQAPLAHGDTLRIGEVNASFEIQAEVPKSALGHTISRKLCVQPVSRARPLAATLAMLAGILVLVAATAWERGCSRATADGKKGDATASSLPAG